MATTHFVTRFTHVSRHFWVYCREQKKVFRENCFANVVSDLKKNGLCVHKTTFRKKGAKTKKNKTKKQWERLQSLANSGDKTSCSGIFLRPHFQNSFSYIFGFCFLLLTPKCLETCVHCVTTCVTVKNYPMNVQILLTFFKVTLCTI